MMSIAQAVLEAMQGGPPVVTATMVQSALPNLQSGDKMVVRADGSTIGGLGGGACEEAVIRHCLAAIPRHVVEAVRFTPEGEVVSDRHAGAAVEVMIEVVEPPARLVVVGGGHIGRSLVKMG